MLVEKGAEVQAKGRRHDDALQAACDEGHEKVTVALIEKGFSRRAEGTVVNNPVWRRSIQWPN